MNTHKVVSSLRWGTVLMLGLFACRGATAEPCGMWAGSLSAKLVNCSPPTFLVSGQGAFSGCCGGPGCWPSIIVKNVTTGYTEWFDVGGCGGCDCLIQFVFSPLSPHYSEGDTVMFIRANRGLGQEPNPCEDSGPAVTVPTTDPSNTTAPMFQGDDEWGDEMLGECPGGPTIRRKGCSLTSAAMLLSYHAEKHGLPGVSPLELQEWLNWNDLFAGCHVMNWNAVAQYGKGVMHIPGFAFCGYTNTGGNLSEGEIRSINEHLCNDGPVVLKVKSNVVQGGDHFVLATLGSLEGNFGINDPATGGPGKLSDYKTQAQAYICFRSAKANFDGDPAIAVIAWSDADQVTGMLTDPLGRRVGYDPAQEGFLQEVDNSIASIDRLSDDMDGIDFGVAVFQFLVSQAVPGKYTLETSYPADGHYSVTLQSRIGPRWIDAAVLEGEGIKGQIDLHTVCLGADGRLDIGESCGTCAADCDNSGALDLFDFLCYTNAFNAGQPKADCDENTVRDLFDFLCFVNAFNEGCP